MDAHHQRLLIGRAATLATTAFALASIGICPTAAQDIPGKSRVVAVNELAPLDERERAALRMAAGVPELGEADVWMLTDQSTHEPVAVSASGEVLFGAFMLAGQLHGFALVDLQAHAADFDALLGIDQIAPSVYVVLANSGVYLFMHPGTGRAGVQELDIDPAPFAYLSTAEDIGLDSDTPGIVFVGDSTVTVPVALSNADLWRDSTYPLAPGRSTSGDAPTQDDAWPLVTLSTSE